MTLAIFDLDHTLINGDSDYLWGEYMVKNGIVDEAVYRARNEDFYDDYRNGRLDNDLYLEFALKPLTQHSIADLHAWREDYVQQWIKPIVSPGTERLLESHRSEGHKLIIISATNLFVSEPIGAMLNVATVLATEPEIVENRYTGKYIGVATYQAGKITALEKWLQQNSESIEGAYFYSDSMNDLPLLDQVDNPIAVNPEPELETIAKNRNWKIIDLL